MEDQLWVVNIRGFIDRRFFPYARIEKEAVLLWWENDNKLTPREWLRAVPRNVERVTTARDLVRGLANTLCDKKADFNPANLHAAMEYSLADLGFVDEARAASPTWADKLPPADPALTIVRKMALMFREEDAEVSSDDFLDFLTRELDQAGFLAEARAGVRREPVPSRDNDVLTTEEQAALRAWVRAQNRTWKAALRRAWETGNFNGSAHEAALQRIRNRLGPSWLRKYQLPVDLDDETKGYSCWVVTSRTTQETRSWVAMRRAEAVAQVKTAVQDTKSEGGVVSRDPEKPFEVTFAMVRGRLVTTRHTD